MVTRFVLYYIISLNPISSHPCRRAFFGDPCDGGGQLHGITFRRAVWQQHSLPKFPSTTLHSMWS